MLTFSRLFLRAEVTALELGDLDELAGHSFRVAAEAVPECFTEAELGLIVRVREGSLVVVVVLIGTANFLFKAISKYPDFREGLLLLIQDGRDAGKWIRNRVIKHKELRQTSIRTRVTPGHSAQVDRVFREVEQGWKSPEEGHHALERIFKRAGETLSYEHSGELRSQLDYAAAHPRKPRKQRPRSAVKRVRSPRRFRREVEIRRNPGETRKLKKYFPQGRRLPVDHAEEPEER